MAIVSNCMRFEHSTGDHFDGIINYFNQKYDSDKFNQIVVADASSTMYGRSKPNVVIDLKNRDKNYPDWITEDFENSSFTVQFLRHRVKLSSYLLLGRYTNNWNFPYHWVLEGTNDFIDWHKLHEYNNINDYLDNKKYFHAQTEKVDQYFRIFRITQKGTNTKNDGENFMHCLSFRGIDLFGSVCFDNSLCHQTHQSQLFHVSLISAYIINILIQL